MRLPAELFEDPQELPTYVITPAEYLADLMRSGRVSREEQEMAVRYGRLFDEPPSDETAEYMRHRLNVRGLGCRDLGYEEPK